MSPGQKSVVWTGLKFSLLTLISDTVVHFNKSSLCRVIGTSAPAIKAPKTNSITNSMSSGFPADTF